MAWARRCRAVAAVLLLLSLFVKPARAITGSAAPDLSGSHRGGTLRVTVPAASDTLDPQMTYSSAYLQLFVTVYDGLLAYRRAMGPEGLEVVPDLAEAMPEVSADGRTWTFQLRRGLRFSDGAVLTTDDVVASFRRIFRIGSPTADTFYNTIIGADACLKTPQSCQLEGVSGDVHTGRVTFRLTRPDPQFAQKLAFSHAVILPKSAPDEDTGGTPLPGTGPYHIASYSSSPGLRLERNPFFKVWSALTQPDGYVDHIQVDFGLTDEAAVSAVARGQYDVMLGEKPQDRYAELGGRYASQVHLQPLLGYYYLVLNVHEPPFTSLDVRQAINDAVDRQAVAILFGGNVIATPLCQLVPYGMGASDIPCQYGQKAGGVAWVGPDIARARLKVRESGFTGASVTLVVRNNAVDTNIGLYMRDLLQKLGFRAALRTLAPESLAGYIGNSDHHVAMALTTWYADYPSPSNFLYSLLGCANYHPGLDISTNAAGFCDPTLEAVMQRALTAFPAEKADAFWRQADEIAMRGSALVPLIQTKYIDFVSRRLGHYRYSLLNHLILSEVWVQ